MKACAIARMQGAAFRGVTWLGGLSHSSEGPDRLPEALQTYYKLPLALSVSGLPDAAAGWLDYVHKTFYDGSGHFADTDSSLPYLTHCFIYRDAWLARAALLLKRELGYTIAESILELQTKDGGFYCSPGDARLGLLPTAVGGLIALSVDNADAARRAANFIVETFELQPHPESVFYLQRYPSGHFVTTVRNGNQNWSLFTPSQKWPLYYVFGFCAGFLVTAAEILHCRELVPAAAAFYYYYKQVCGPAGTQHPYSGKMGWASSLLYRRTGIEHYADTAIAIANYLMGRQRSDGAWLLEEFTEPQQACYLPLIVDRTSEFVVWLTQISRNMRDLDLPARTRAPTEDASPINSRSLPPATSFDRPSLI